MGRAVQSHAAHERKAFRKRFVAQEVTVSIKEEYHAFEAVHEREGYAVARYIYFDHQPGWSSKHRALVVCHARAPAIRPDCDRFSEENHGHEHKGDHGPRNHDHPDHDKEPHDHSHDQPGTRSLKEFSR